MDKIFDLIQSFEGFCTYFYSMELSQGEIQKAKMQELSSLFMTNRLNVMRALVKFLEYNPYGLGVMAWTRFTIWKQVKGK